MAVAPLGNPLSATAVPHVGPASPAATKAPGTGFSDVVRQVVQDANAQQIQADQTLDDFVTGKVDHVHDVVLAMAQADLTFRLVLEIRNRLIESYQELMRMQI